MRRRIVITGMGTLSSAGANLGESRRNFAGGICCLSEIKDPQVKHLKARFAGLLRDFEPARSGVPSELEAFDKHVAMAFVAAHEALDQAAVRPAEAGRRLGLIFSTCSGPMLLIERHYERIIRGDPGISEAELYAKKYYSGAQVLARVLGIQGITTTVVTACTAGTSAIALAADLIRCGMLEAALAGGADAFSMSTLAGFDGLKATSEGRCAPFSKPLGLNLGEAATFLYLETYDSARQRGARVHGEVIGSGMSNDAYHCSSPEPTGRGLVLAIQRAMHDANVRPEQIAYINAHGTGTEANDKAETRAIRKVFGACAERVPVSSTKSMVGHCLGAAGLIEVVASITCAEAGVFPPTANFAGPREGCTLDCIPDAGRSWKPPRTFLSSNLAFGGHNASLVIALPNNGETGPLGSRSAAEAAGTMETPGSNGTNEVLCVTGCGLVSSVGLGAQTLLAAIRNGKFGPKPILLPGWRDIQAGMVDQEALETFDRRLDLRHMDRSSRLATVATQMAIHESGFSRKPADLAALGLYLHLATGPSWAESEFLTSFLRRDHRVEQLVSFPYIVPSSVAGNVCRALRLTGRNVTLSCGPGAGLLGLGPAIAALRSSHTEALLSGAVDELSDRILMDNCAAGVLKPDGVPPGEGAAVLMLETARHARGRSARPLAFIRGYACVSDTGRPAAPTAALEEAVREALALAEVLPDSIGAVCFHSPEPWARQALESVCPGWADRYVDVSRHTGQLEGTQPLLNLAAALLTLPAAEGAPGFVLAVVSSRNGGTSAVVFEKV
jgi:3-oxoacyl-[acyl-carrier-protein] synthase II